ncbi:MAG: hypothetical protein LBK61_06200 [Spirochaetaceae bacterium]|nr:hypothetical protein [Spirochaetaceae bacterium]
MRSLRKISSIANGKAALARGEKYADGAGATACGGGPALGQTPHDDWGLVWADCREFCPASRLYMPSLGKISGIAGPSVIANEKAALSRPEKYAGEGR